MSDSTPPSLPPRSRAIPPAVSEHLRERLLALPFADFAALISRLLIRMGYQEVQLMGATHEKGRNLHGGYDLQASVQAGVTRSLVLVQAKQYARPVPRAFVDELRGAMVRLGAQQGVILSTDTFSPAAREAAQAGQHGLPLRLVGGEELVRLMLQHEVVPEPDDARNPVASKDGNGNAEPHTPAEPAPVPRGKRLVPSGQAITILLQFAPALSDRPEHGGAGTSVTPQAS